MTVEISDSYTENNKANKENHMSFGVYHIDMDSTQNQHLKTLFLGLINLHSYILHMVCWPILDVASAMISLVAYCTVACIV